MVLFGTRKTARESGEDESRFEPAREAYFSGKIKIVTTDGIPGREVKFVFGLVVARGYNPDNAFFGLVSRALEAGADAIVGYRESVAFHPEGDKHYSCYGTAMMLEPLKR